MNKNKSSSYLRETNSTERGENAIIENRNNLKKRINFKIYK